eukprot:SM000087S23358  [mRNA]  locus=s87:246084:248724:- [translate_table: standard]
MAAASELLQHFRAALAAVEADFPAAREVARLACAPQSLDPWRASSVGEPVVFPASWAPDWRRELRATCIPAGLSRLLGDVVEVEVFHMCHEARMTQHPEVEGPTLGPGTQEAVTVCAKTQLASGTENQTTRPVGTRAPLSPIPTSVKKTMQMSSFLEEAERLACSSQDSCLYLTWRGLPSCNQLNADAPPEFRIFVENLLSPTVFPPFIEAECIRQQNLWVGSSVTSRIHFDALDNVHICISGSKVFHLYSPWDMGNLYPTRWQAGALNNTSAAQSILLRDVSNYSRLFYQATRLKSVIRAGEAIIIPAGWWHEVEQPTGDYESNLCVFTLDGVTCTVNSWIAASQAASLRPTLLMLNSLRVPPRQGKWVASMPADRYGKAL